MAKKKLISFEDLEFRKRVKIRLPEPMDCIVSCSVKSMGTCKSVDNEWIDGDTMFKLKGTVKGGMFDGWGFMIQVFNAEDWELYQIKN